RAALGSRRADDDLRAELEAHLEMDIAEHVRRGMSPDEARRAALIAAGGVTLAVEAVRERRGLPQIEQWATDLRYAMRTLRNKPAYTIAMILTLALGIGANSAMFTIVNAVVFRPLPYPDADRIVAISLGRPGEDRHVVDDRNYFAWLESAKSVDLAATSYTTAVFALPDGAVDVPGARATRDYFAVFGATPILGRTFNDDELRQPGIPAIILGERLWRASFNADPAIVGKSASVDGHAATIVGVMPAWFQDRGAEWWRPNRIEPPTGRATFFYTPIARLRSGYTMDAARAELTTITERVREDRIGAEQGLRPILMTLHERRYGNRRKPLLVLFAAVGVLLAIACANLANLTLARAAGRQRELSLRLVLGAGRWRVVRGLLCESVLLSLGGALAGLLVARGAVAYAIRLSPASVGNMQGIHIDSAVLLFTLLMAVATSVAFGLVPAIVASRGDVHAALATSAPRSAGSAAQLVVRRLLVVAQLATALVLLTGAGLVARTFWRVAAIDPGFRPSGAFLFGIRLPSSRYTEARPDVFYRTLIERVRGLPGVRSAALTDGPPLAYGVRMRYGTHDVNGDTIPRIDVVAAGRDYFETIGATLLHGRTFTDADRAGALPVAVVDAALARRMFGTTDVLGRTLPYLDHPLRIVGVARDVLHDDLEQGAAPTAYLPIGQSGVETFETVIVRATTPAESLEPTIIAIVRSMDPALAPPKFDTMEHVVDQALAPR